MTASKREHESFQQPRDTSVRVWRYMDLAKLVALLSERQLYLPRVDRLNDPYEGSITARMKQTREDMALLLRNEQFAGHVRDTQMRFRALFYVSCWYKGNDESEAMWRLYCPGDLGVAIQSTYEKLARWADGLPEETYIGEVKYIDYKNQTFRGSEGRIHANAFDYVMHKRLAFAHENEVRIVRADPDAKALGAPRVEPDEGVRIEFQPQQMLEHIFVDPYAPEWFEKVVKTVVTSYAPSLSNKVEWSRMRAGPDF